MKRLLSILVLVLILTGCSAQKRAERHMRKAVALCPELVQLKAHPIDTVLTVPGFADVARVPLPKVLAGDTLYAATDHGTVVVSLSDTDSSLRVGFVAAPQKIRFKDQVEIAQVAIEPTPQAREKSFWSHFALVLLGLGTGVASCLWLLRYVIKPNKTIQP